MFERLLTTPAEETDRTHYLKQVSEREKNNAVQIGKLQTQLDAAIEVCFKKIFFTVNYLKRNHCNKKHTQTLYNMSQL